MAFNTESKQGTDPKEARKSLIQTRVAILALIVGILIAVFAFISAIPVIHSFFPK